jgi:hypothetical protein
MAWPQTLFDYTNFIHGGVHFATEPIGFSAVTMGWMERGAWLCISLLDLLWRLMDFSIAAYI